MSLVESFSTATLENATCEHPILLKATQTDLLIWVGEVQVLVGRILLTNYFSEAL